MRKLLLLSVFLLNGCTVVDAYLMTHYDPNEYGSITTIRADAGQFKTRCNDLVISRANAEKIAYETNAFKLYSENIPKNTDNYKSAVALNEIAQGLVDRYNKPDPVNPIFCKLKFEGIESSATLMQHVIGNRPR
jgi:hypothetical protein